MNNDELLFVPLGGTGEIGLNAYLYGQNDRWMMVDFGIGFADDSLPGVDILLPDPSFAEELGEKLEGIVVTHVHEDHAGAIAYLWPRLRCPVWCSRFAAAVLRRRLAEAGLERQVPVRVVEPGEPFAVGPFRCTLVPVTHSIPESHALAIRTAHGTVLHSGDWKLDPEPLLGAVTDTDALEQLGREGVLALISDSTNVLVPGTSGSEAEVRDSLRDLIAKQPGRVALTTFASNVARLESAVLAGHAAGREVALVGRSIKRMVEAAREVGYLQDMPPVIDERDAMQLPRDKAMFLVTGSQGEPRAALTRIANGQHHNVKLDPGDTVVFSSKIIPGNERTLYALHNHLVRRGIEVITEHDHFVHVSGHPCRDEIEQLYRWLKPRICIPMHGEPRHLHEHVLLARRLGVPEVVQVENGSMVRLAPGPVEVVDEVPTGRLVVDNGDVVREGDERFRTRRRLMSHGTVMVGLVLDAYGSVLSPPAVSAFGLAELDDAARTRVGEELADAIEGLGDREVLDDERVRETVRTAVRRGLALSRDQRPIIEVQVTRVSGEALAALESDVGAA